MSSFIYANYRIVISGAKPHFYNMRHYLFLLLLIYVYSSRAQNAKLIDSLERTLPGLTADTLRADYVCALAFEYRVTQPDKATRLANEAYSLSQKTGYISGQALALNHLGILCKNRGAFDSAVMYHRQALQLREQINEWQGIASSHNNLGVTYRAQGNLTKSAFHYLQALRIREQNNDVYGMAVAWKNLSQIYQTRGKTDIAFRFLKKSLALMQQAGDEMEIARTHIQLAYNYYERNIYDKAELELNKAISILQKLGDESNRCEALTMMGNICTETGRLSKAEQYFSKALVLAKSTDDQIGMMTLELSLGQYFFSNNDFKNGVAHTNAGLAIAENLDNKDAMRDGYELLYKAYREKGIESLALHYADKFYTLKNELITAASDRTVSELQTQYETEKKDLEIAKQHIEIQKAQEVNQRQRMQLSALAVLLFMVVVIAYLAYSRYKLRQKALLDAERLQQQELRNQSIIEAEEKERMRIARELHDGIGQQLSALKMNLSAMEPEAKPQPALHDKLVNLIKLTDDAVKEVRGVSHQMIPNALLRSGLAGAVRDFINYITASGKLNISLSVNDMNRRIDTTKEAVLYRVLQECVNNIIKHAQATHVTIQLVMHPTYLNLIVEDNGKGFDTAALKQGEGGIGLRNIESRIAFLQGTVEFDSTPGHGTTVIIDVPV